MAISTMQGGGFVSDDTGMPEGRQWLLRNGRNVILDRLARGEPVMSLGVRAARTVDIVKVAQATGHHLIWIDLEHSTMSIDVAAQMCSAAGDAGVVPFVRVPEREYGVIGRLLDGGAVGIMAPRVETAEQAQEIARACRFAPAGVRSQIVGLPLFGMRKVPPPAHNQLANRATVVMILLETELGFRNVEAIAAVEGVDIVGSGSNDFSAELGALGNYRHEKILSAYAAAIKGCAKAGKPFAVGGVGDMGYVKAMIQDGAAPFLYSAIDSEFLRDALQEKVASVLAALR